MEIGLFFGSFNPIHIGHLIIANYVLNLTEVREVWFVVSPHNPFKQNEDLLGEQYRLSLVQKAISGNKKLKAVDIEFKLSRPSYTVNTLLYLKEKYPRQKFSMIMGSDSFQALAKWKDYEQIISQYPLFVYTRPGFEVQNEINARLTILKTPLLGISSTEIRDLIKNGRSIRYLVPDAVRKEIKKNKYYRK